MSNTFSNLIPTLYSAQQIVSRELTGAIAAVDQRFDDKGAAIGEVIRVPVAPTRGIQTYTPAMTTTQGADSAEGFVNVTIANNYMASFYLTGEQIRFLELGGGGDLFRSWMEQSWVQCMRTVANQIETDLCTTLYQNASRVTGTAGTSPFGSNLTPAAAVRKILDDNGAPMPDRHLVVSTAAGFNLRGLANLTQYLQAGTTEVLNGGLFFDLFGLGVRESAGIVTTTKGTGTTYTVNGAQPVGTTTIPATGGTGTIVAGDVVTIGSDTNNYVVVSALSGGSFTIGNPGLKVAASNAATITVGNNYSANIALQRSACVAIVRPPIIPRNPLISTYNVTDEKTGLTFMAAEVVGDGMITYRLHAASGYGVVQSQHIAGLMG